MVEQQDPSAGDANNSPTPTRATDQDNTEHPCQDEPPAEQRGAERLGGSEVAKGRDTATATHDVMTPKSSAPAATGTKEYKEYGPLDSENVESDIIRRDKADIEVYRNHFSEYKEDRAHLSSNPYIESDKLLEGAECRHDIPRRKADLILSHPGSTASYQTAGACCYHSGHPADIVIARQGGKDIHESRPGPPFPYQTPAATQGKASSQHDMQPPGRLGHAPSAANPEAARPAHSPRENQGEETHGDMDGHWTERMRDLKKYAETHGATLRSMSPDEKHPTTFTSDDPRSSEHHRTRSHDEVQGREAAMALYAYPRVENGRQFFERVPGARQEELARVKRDLKDMEEQLQSATKERINEVAATLATGPLGARSIEPRRG